jgi:hypothetical protein
MRRSIRAAPTRILLLAVTAAIAMLGFSAPHAAMAAPARSESEGTVEFSSQLVINGRIVSHYSRVRPAGTFPSSGFHAITPQDPSWNFSDKDGTGDEQINFSSNTQQWGYTLSAAVQALVVGNVSENADLYHGSTRTNFGPHVVIPNYIFHGSSGGISTSGTYANTILITFKCNVGVNCTGSVSAKWQWYKSLV